MYLILTVKADRDGGGIRLHYPVVHPSKGIQNSISMGCTTSGWWSGSVNVYPELVIFFVNGVSSMGPLPFPIGLIRGWKSRSTWALRKQCLSWSM